MQSIPPENQIIGGMFGLHLTRDPDPDQPASLNGQSLWLINARSGIFCLISSLRPPQVWCPSYTCHTVIDAIKKSNPVTRFYEVDDSLEITDDKWIEKVKEGDLVILTDYFGFPMKSDCYSSIMKRGAFILEDASQAFLSKYVGKNSDFCLFSPRKFAGVPDGGILVANRGYSFEKITLAPPPAEWWMEAFRASLLRREFDLIGGERSWFEIFQKAEKNSPIGFFSISDLSRQILNNHINYSSIARSRRDNYQALANRLYHLALFPTLPGDVVPLGFPIRLKDREQVRQKLFSRNIYPPIHWEIKKVIPTEYRRSHTLSNEIMTLPCDQRYTTEEMEMMASIILEELR